MRVALQKLDGVESVEVRLKDGKAIVQLKSGNTVRLEQIRKAVTEKGFTPKEARISAMGKLVITEKGVQVQVKGSGETFASDATPGPWREKAGQTLMINGIVAAPRNPQDPGLIQLLEASKEPPPQEPD